MRVAKQDRHLRAESASSRSTSSSALETSRGFRFLGQDPGPRKPKQEGFILSSAGGGTVEPTLRRRQLRVRCQKGAPSGFNVLLSTELGVSLTVTKTGTRRARAWQCAVGPSLTRKARQPSRLALVRPRPMRRLVQTVTMRAPACHATRDGLPRWQPATSRGATAYAPRGFLYYSRACSGAAACRDS